MSGVESAAKPFLEPMLLGRRVVMQIADQRAVANWIVLKAMVIEQTDPLAVMFTREKL